MVALRGGNNSLNPVSHTCANHGNRATHTVIDMQHNIHSSISVQQAVAHLNQNSVNLQTLNNISLQFLPHQSNSNHLKHEQTQARFTRTSCLLPTHHYRVLAQSRAECYPPVGAGATYLTAGNPGAGQVPQQAMRVPTAQQPQQPTQPQQDLAKNAVLAHKIHQPSARQQFSNFSTFRPAQHGSRPSSHPRQAFLTGATTGTPSMMYHPQPLMFQTTHMGLPQTYQQPRSQYYPYMPQYLNYSNAGPHNASYYFTSGNQQMTAPGLASNAAGGRTNSAPLVQQGAPANQPTPTAPLPHLQQSQTHMHQNLSGMRTNKRVSHRIPIIDPSTQQDILSDIISNDAQYVSGDSSERQTPQPETNSIVEDFARRVSEAASQPSASELNTKTNFVSKNIDITTSPPTCTLQTQSDAISSVINVNVLVKSDILSVNESKCLGPDVAVESSETPVVSAISDSPVIVPKICPTNKKQTKSEQPLVVDNNKSIPSNKQPHKQTKNIPLVPQNDEDLESDIASPIAAPLNASPPLPQRVREPRERGNSEDKSSLEKNTSTSNNIEPNGPTSLVTVASSADSLPEAISSESSHYSETLLQHTSLNPFVQTNAQEDSNTSELRKDPIEEGDTPILTTTVNELFNAGIEAVPTETKKDLSTVEEPATDENLPIISEAQAKLNESLIACNRPNQVDIKIKDINLNNTVTDPDTANGNTPDTGKTDSNEELHSKDIDTKNTFKIDSSDDCHQNESYENGKEDTELQQDDMTKSDESLKSLSPPVFVPKYKYSDYQWSPLNKSGKKCYDLDLLKQIRDDPLSKNKPDIPKLEQCKVMRTIPIMEPLSFVLATSRPTSDALFPNFVKPAGGMSKNTLRDIKKDIRSIAPTGKGSVKLSSPGGSSPLKHNVIHVSLSLRDDVKLNETENAWKPTRFKRESISEEEYKTQDLYKKFRGILNKLTPQKFDTLLDRVKTLKIDTQKRLEGVIDLVFEKAIDEPNFSEAYAAMCNKLSTLKVPADNPTTPDQCVNFRGLIISKCQAQFVASKVDEHMKKMEKNLSDCNDSGKRKELQAQIEEENRRIRMRSVGNVRFIGELYKLKMLTAKIMAYCMNYLIEKLEEEKLECLCKLLTTIGEQVENEVKDKLNEIFKKMQDIVDRKSNKISSRVRFMLQDVIELRKRHWVAKSVVDLQPKMMDQIQKEAEQQHRQTELLNSSMGGGYGRRDDGNRGKRGDGRRQNQNFMDNSSTWKPTRPNFTVDTSKFKAVNKTLADIKLAPIKTQWGHGSGTKNNSATNPIISLPTTTNNKYSVLENVHADPTAIRGGGNKDVNTGYHSKGASIERSTFNARGDYPSSNSGSRSGSVNAPRPTVGSHSTSATVAAPVAAEVTAQTTDVVQQEPLTDPETARAKSIIEQFLLISDENEMMEDFKHFGPQHQAGIVTCILNVALEKPAREMAKISHSVLNLITTNTISTINLESGLLEVFEIAPDLYIDIPMLYEYLSVFVVPQIQNKHITFAQILKISDNIIAANQGHLLLKSLIKDLKDSMGPTFVKSKWQESGLQLYQWMKEDQVKKFIEENMFEFLEGEAKPSEETHKIFTPAETHSKLLQLMNAEENCECIRGWVNDNLSKSSNENWFMRALIQAICEHALFGPEGRNVPHFNQDKMNKYSELINEFGESRVTREASCLFGIQHLIVQLEHPQGLTLDIFQYLHEQYVISVEGFIEWEQSDKEPEGKGVMMKALTSFFTSIKEADNEDSFSED